MLSERPVRIQYIGNTAITVSLKEGYRAGPSIQNAEAVIGESARAIGVIAQHAGDRDVEGGACSQALEIFTKTHAVRNAGGHKTCAVIAAQEVVEVTVRHR